jgi:protein kinase C substrate 80K-H
MVVDLIVSGAYDVGGADEQILMSSCSRFSSWNTDAPLGSPEYHTKQHYTHGAKCWNGPERSITVRKTSQVPLIDVDSGVQVVFICGIENALLAVSEPEKCEYKVTGTTPALCRPLGDGEKPGDSPAVKVESRAKEDL